MEEHQQAPTAHEERLEELGAAESTESRRQAARLAGAAKIKAACALYDSIGSEGQVLAAVKAMCVQAMPAIMENMVRMAKGEPAKRGGAPPPASAQVQATQLVAGAAGLALEASPGDQGGPLSEMSLSQLDETLLRLHGRVKDMQALEGQALALPQQGSAAPEQQAPEPEPGQ